MYKTETYYEDDDCKVSLQEVEGNLFVHVSFNRASKAIMLRLLKVWAEIKAKCYWLGYEAIYAYTTEPRMKVFFPGSKSKGFFDYKGQRNEVLEWELN